MMAPSARKYPHALKVAITLILIIISSLSILPSKTVGLQLSKYYKSKIMEVKKMMVGSRPPGCVNKCMSCRPCMATLVIPPHRMEGFRESSHGEEEDNYYLLSWKCRCGDKLYQP